ncbi:MAG TPA: GDSL-type esterase/lipase family protein [Chitinophagaceae bacterium]|nr:GDSL-type esterase/lipase family protein [Chitinophagaceae bacterium]
MNQTNCSVRKFALRSLGLLLLVLVLQPSRAQQADDPYADEIRAFRHQDSLEPPPSHAILFVGSSSFRFWKDVQQDFPGYTIINRGFGGSTLPDVIRHAGEIILPYHPREVVIYCGENDLAYADTVSPELVLARFRTLFGIIRHAYPRLPIVFVSIKPSPSRQQLMPRMLRANVLIRQFLARRRKTYFVDVYHRMLTQEGTPMPDIFGDDNLHMNRKGYAIWQEAIRPFLIKD